MDLKDYEKIARDSKKTIDDIHKHCAEVQKQELAKRGIIVREQTEEEKRRAFYGDCDHPNTLENGTATILYILSMIGGAIFNDRILIWIVATIIYVNFITRHDN